MIKMRRFFLPATIFCFLLIFLTTNFLPAILNVSFAATSDEERKALEQQLAELEKQIIEDEAAIANYQKQGKTYQTEINKLTTQIGKINLQIKAVNISLEKLNKEINENQSQLKKTEDKLDFNKNALTQTLESLYEKDDTTMVEMLLKSSKLSDFFGDMTELVEVQDSLTTTVKNITGIKIDLLDIKEQLAIKKNDIEALKAYQDAQRKAVQSTKEQKNDLLTAVKNKEAKSQDILKETKKTAAQIRSRIFKLLGGGELPFGEAVKFAELAGKSTGVRAAFILAVLTQESAIRGVIGKNLGQCYYDTPWKNPEGKVMRLREATIFLKIIEGLGLNPQRMPVSCPISSDGLYGGAMGPAQFMASTWLTYQNKISDVTGNDPSNPWNNADAFVATALYLKDAMNGCRSIYNSTIGIERCAAAKYYAGGNWKVHLWDYGDPVATRAQQFQSDIDILNA